MKLLFSDKFTIDTEINGTAKTLTGKFKRLDKKQEADVKKKFKKELDLIEDLVKLSKEANKLEMRMKINPDDSKLQEQAIDLFDKVSDVQDKVTKSDTKEAMAKYRFDISVESDDLSDLISICESYGYSEVINAISESVEEGKQKSTKA